jgi:hypothetical protein
MMMARGGLAAIPVRGDMFEYAGGGIVAFQSGGQSLNERAARQMEEKGSIYDPYFGLPAQERERMKQEAKLKAAQDRSSQSMAVTESNARALAEGAQARVNELESNRDSLIRQYGAKQYEQALAKAKQAIDAASSRGSELMAQQSQMGQSMVAEATPPPRPAAPISRPTEQMTPQQMEARMAPAGLPGAAQQMSPVAAPAAGPTAPRPMAAAQRPAPAAQPAGLPAAVQDRSPYFAQVDADLAKPIAAPTPEGIIAQQRALSPEAMQEEFMKKRMEEQRQRAASERAAFEKGRPSGLDDLIRVFGQAGQYKGLSGLAPAYTANKQQQRAEELAMEQRQNQLLNAIDAREYEGGKELFGARSKSMDAANTAYQNQLMTRTKSLADMAGVDQRRMDEAANRLTQVQLEKMRIAARAAEANRPGEAERIEATYMGMVAKGKQAEADEYLARISKIKGGAGGDRNPTPTDRLRAAQSIVNDMDATPEEKAEARKEIIRISSGSKPEGGGKPITKAEYDKLPKGATYIAPDGTQRTKG